jgi:hypothetical protein
VLAHDRHLADLSIAETELVVGESDGARIVRAFGLAQGFREKRDAARRLAARNGETAVDPPKVGQPGRIKPLPPLRWRPERLGRPPHIVLKQPGFGERTPDLDLFVALKTRLSKAADQQGRRFGPHSSLEGTHGLSVKISR